MRDVRADATGPPRRSSARRDRPGRLLGTLVAIELVVAVTGSLGPPLLADVSRHWDVSPAAAQWTLTVTLLSGCFAIPVIARLGDGPNRRRVIVTTLTIVAAGGLCTVAPLGFTGVLVGRVLQGVGFGLTPLVIGAARDVLPDAGARSAIGVLSIASVACIGLGYPAAGALSQYGGPRSAYAAGLAVVVGTLALAARSLPPDRGDREPVRIDVVGVLLLGAAVVGLLLLADNAGSGALPVPLAVGGAVPCVLLGAAWARRELRSETPLVDLRHLTSPLMVTASGGVLAGGLAAYALISLASRYVQTSLGSGLGVHGGALTAGTVLVSFSATSFVASRYTARIPRRCTAALIPLACAICAAAAVAFASMRSGIWSVVTVMALVGTGVGILFAAASLLIVESVAPDQTASAIGFNLMARTLGVAAGSALCGAVLQSVGSTGGASSLADGYTAAAVAAAVIAMTTAVATAVIVGLRRSKPDG
ncbi:MFS transporter [Mycobacterium sp. NPDC003449]